MPLTVNTTQALGEGAALLLAADCDPALGVAWDPEAGYTDGQVGIWLAVIPTRPDRMISLSPRQVTADPTLAESLYGLQVRVRGTRDPRVVWALRDGIRDVLLGRWPTVLPSGLQVRTVDFAGGTSLGQDDANRFQWSDNYVFGVGEHRARPF